MKDYRIIFIDIDGTLKNDNREISSKTKEVLSKLKSMGIIVVICSGRPVDYVKNISEKCGASRYVVASNGGDVFDCDTNNSIFCNKMSNESCKKLYDIAVVNDAKFMVHTMNSSIVDFSKYLYENTLLEDSIDNFLYNKSISQCVIYSRELDPVKKTVKFIEKVNDIEIKSRVNSLIDENIPLYGNAYIDVAKKDTSKGLGIKKLLEYLNISKENTVGIGDGLNDLPMFENVDFKIAMGNAFDEVKSASDTVTDDNNNDGVANALIKLFDLEV